MELRLIVVLFLGVDGGGTSTRAVLGGPEGDIIATGRSSAAQAHRASVAEVEQAVIDAAESALAAAHCTWTDVAGSCIGLAGIGRDETRRQVQTALTSRMGERLLLRTDYEVALTGAWRDAPGVLVLAGTGAIGVAQTATGKVLRCGGWGGLLGDEGSGVWIGREALRAVLWAADGRGPVSTLTDSLMQAHQVAVPAGLVWHFAGRADPARDLADLVPHVLSAARAGDGVARQILEHAGRHVGELAVVLVRQAALEPPQVAYGGGVLTNSEVVRETFLDLVRRETGATAVAAAHDGAAGALWLAVRQFGEKH